MPKWDPQDLLDLLIFYKMKGYDPVMAAHFICHEIEKQKAKGEQK